ncbi:hypothetical protein MVEN_01418000 [Mycena venus]|uniref:Uncharacterized protein n=1 Tax=Mycena venus TaxID=2733690 RepID=A0A8H7CUY6_9AGAR|nr:hypothetical protein MVEN_01418000 [Mycena venus]
MLTISPAPTALLLCLPHYRIYRRRQQYSRHYWFYRPPIPTADISRHPEPSSSTSHRVHGARVTITIAGVFLLSTVIFGLVFGLIKFARNYWRTPRSSATWELDRRQFQFNALWFDTVLGEEGLLHPPPPPYFPRPPSYDGTCPSPKDDLAVCSRLDWHGQEALPSSRRHSV